MRAGGAFLTGAFATLTVAACGFSLDGYSGGKDDAGAGGSTTDGSTTLDGATPSEGGVKPGSDAGADGAIALCDQPNLFCTTFDGPDFTGIADTKEVCGGCVVEIADGNEHTSTPSYTGGDHLSANISHHIQNAGLKTALEVDVFVTTPAWGSYQGNGSILSVTRGDVIGEELYLSNGYVSVTTTSEHNNYLFDSIDENLDYDRWVRVRLEVDFTPTTGSFVLYFDGKKVSTRTGISFASQPADSFTGIRFGLNVPNASTPPLDTRFDNAIVTALP